MLKRTDPDAIEEFESDESGSLHAAGVEAIYYPENAEDVSRVLLEGNTRHLPVTVSGAGTGITGARVATCGGLVMSMAAMRRAALPPDPTGFELIEAEQFGQTYALYFSRERAEVCVPAGMSVQLLDQMLPHDLYYPPDPTEATASLGGTIATNASGARTFHYGATRDWVQALDLVLPTGDLLSLERGQVCASPCEAGPPGGECLRLGDYGIPIPRYSMPALKNAAGLYARPGMDAVDLFVGCEGLLGIVTSARLRLAPRPEEDIAEIAFFATEEQALGFVDDMRAAAAAGTLVLSLEFFDANSLRFMRHPQVRGDYGAAVYVEVVGALDEAEALLEALETHEVAQDWFAETEADRKEQREFRHSLPEGVNTYVRRQGSHKLGTDLVVPGDRFRELLALYHEVGEEFSRRCPREGAHWLMFGHIGNHHLHFNFLPHNASELEIAGELYSRLAQAAIAMGGTISGEHGVGKKTIGVAGQRLPYLQLMYGEEGLCQIAAAKRAVDPGWILNPGNMLPAPH